MSTSDLIWSDDSYAKHRLEFAIAGSQSATIRVQRMKVLAITERATQIDLHQRFPYPGHRTCAEWFTA